MTQEHELGSVSTKNLPQFCTVQCSGTMRAQFSRTPLPEGRAGRLLLTKPEEMQHPPPTHIQEGASELRDTFLHFSNQLGNCCWTLGF